MARRSVALRCFIHGDRISIFIRISTALSPAAALNKIGQWIPSRKKFFIPVKVLSRMFRGKFLAALKTMDLDFCGSAKQYEDPRDFLNLVDRCYNKEWVA